MRRTTARLGIVLLGLALVSGGAGLALFFWASSGMPSHENPELIRRHTVTEPVPESADGVTIVTHNIGYLSGTTNNRPVNRPPLVFFQANTAALIQALKRIRADIIAFQEIDFHSRRSHYQNQVDLIARKGGYTCSSSVVNWSKRYVPYPYWPPSAHFGPMLSGQAVISRYPILRATRQVLPGPVSKPFHYRAFYLDRLVHRVDVSVGDRVICLLNVHLEAFDVPTREIQARQVVRLVRSLKPRFPLILLGDMNSVPPEAGRRSGFDDEPDMDFRGDRTMDILWRQSGLREVFDRPESRADESSTFTFPSRTPNRRLDYIFYDPDKIERLAAGILPGGWSDHFAVWMRCRVRKTPGGGFVPGRAEKGSAPSPERTPEN